MAAARTVRLVATSVAGASVIASNFAPVPFLAPAVTVVIGIMKLCENVSTNKREIKDLGARCESLLYALKDSAGGYAPERVAEMVESAVAILEDIKQSMNGWLNIGRIRQFVYQDDIAEDVRRKHQAVDSFLTTFQISSHMEIHNWMGQFEENRRMDHAETLTYLADISNNGNILLDMMASQHQHITQMMMLMQNGMGSFQQGDHRHTDLGRNLLAVQERSGQLLPGIELKHGEVRRVGQHPVGGSAAFDIWEGEYLSGAKCALKVVRGVEISPKIRERFLREVEIWRNIYDIDHGEYILPFWGACLDDGPYPYMVSPWMQFGESSSYLKRYPDVNRKVIVYRIAQGLKLLHSQTPPIAHGDMKAANVLVNEKGYPVLADFSLSKIMEELTGMPFTQSRGISDSYRWFAPELCNADGNLSPAADIFAFAMTVLELMTDAPPFSHIKRTPQVLVEMQRGERPRRPQGQIYIERGLDDHMWELLRRCWVTEPHLRPDIDQVLVELPKQ